MKVLLYGVGVIGSLTAHELCRAGNEVTVIARGRWKEVLEQQGLRIHTYSGNKEWTDYPEVLGEYDGNTYDVVFSIMQNQQQTEIVDTLACVQAKYVVLVGNNLQSEKMQQQLIDYGWNANQIIFGFQTSAGVRHEDYTEVITFGTPELTIGHVSSDVSDKEKEFFQQIFATSDMKVTFMDDMQSWYRCHVAFVLPIAYLCYLHHCNLRTCTYRDTKAYIRAGAEAYDFLKFIGTTIRPKHEDRNFSGIRGLLLTAVMWIAAKTKFGDLAASDHCRNAVTEMQFLDQEFNRLREQNPSFAMTTFDQLRNMMPTWEQLHQEYDAAENDTRAM